MKISVNILLSGPKLSIFQEKITYACSVLCASVFLSLAVTSALTAQSFQGLGDLPGGATSSWPSDVSNNGMVVVGTSNTDNVANAFRWTAETGMVRFETVRANEQSEATATSADGSITVGDVDRRAVRWLGSTLDRYLPPLSGKSNDISANGSIVVGTEGGTRVYLWSESGGLTYLSDLSGDVRRSGARGVSPNGSIVVGQSNGPDGNVAVRWEEGEIKSLGMLDGDIASVALDVSSDGLVVGNSLSPLFVQHGFKWSESEGLRQLPQLEGSRNSRALAVSDDGRFIVGDASTPADTPTGFKQEAVYWDSEGTVRRVKAVLQAQGVDLTGWSLTSAVDVSADGNVVVGRGINPAGDSEAWRAELQPVEEEDIVVNDTRDEADYDITDGRCDAVRDDGPDGEAGDQCTLRAAIEEANARGGGTITFNIEAEGVPRIDVTEYEEGETISGITYHIGLPPLEAPITLDATTQPGGWVELVGTGVRGEPTLSSGATTSDALRIEAGGAGSVIRGFVLNRFVGSLVRTMPGANRCVIENNRIGTDVTGTVEMGTPLSLLWDNIAGRPPWEEGAGNDTFRMAGVRLGSNRNIIQDNVIAGNANVKNESEVPDLVGSGGFDVLIDPGTKSNVVRRNHIGVGANGNLVNSSPAGFPFLNAGYYTGVYAEGAAHLIGGSDGDGNVMDGHDIAIWAEGFPQRIVGNTIGPSSGEDERWFLSIGLFLEFDGTSDLRGLVEDNYLSAPTFAVASSGGYDIVGNRIVGTDEWSPLFEGDGGCGGTRSTVQLGVYDAFRGNTVNTKNAWAVRVDSVGVVIDENDLAADLGGVCVPGDSETVASALISRNHIHRHRYVHGIGIDLGADDVLASNDTDGNYGVTPNDYLDTDKGPNNFLNFPRIMQATVSDGILSLHGFIEGAFGATYTIEVFGNSECAYPYGSGLPYGPGEAYLGTVTVETSGSDFGARAFSLLVEGLAPEHRYVTLTSSRLDLGITSEFSRCVRIASPDDVANADVDPNKTGPVLEAVDTRIIVENGDGVAKASEKSSQGAVHPGGKVFATRYDSTPDSSVFAEVSATSSSGTIVSPEFVAPRHWLLVEQGLTTVSDGQTPATFSVCLAPTNAVQRNRLEEIVLLQRNEKTDGWLPHNSYLEMFEEEPYLCAGGLTELGEFGIGGAENGFNSTGEDPDLELPDMISLDQNYPNPFNPQTVIPYSLTTAGRVQIGVYDLLGRRLQTLVDAVMPAGRHQVTFDAGKLSSGIYIYQLESGSTRITQKMMLIK